MDNYEVLGLPKDATPEQIKGAYRALTLKYHPDVNHSPEATEKMKEINGAYSILSDPDARKQYDMRWSTNANSSYQASHAQSTYNYTVNPTEVWDDLLSNLGKYAVYMDDESEIGRRMRVDAVGHIVVDGLDLFFDWLSKRQ